MKSFGGNQIAPVLEQLELMSKGLHDMVELYRLTSQNNKALTTKANKTKGDKNDI